MKRLLSHMPSILFLSLVAGQLFVVSPLPGVYVYAHDLALILMCALWLWQRPWKRHHSFTLLLPFAAFAATAGVSLLVNLPHFSLFESALSSLYLVRFVLYAMLYMIVRDMGSRASWVRGLYLAGVSIAALGFVQYAFYPDLRNISYMGWDPHYYRLVSTLLDPNYSGIVLVMTFLSGIYLWHGADTRQKRIIAMVQAALLVALILTFSRSSYMAFAAALLVLAARKTYAFRVIVAVLAFLLLVVLWPRPGGDTLRLDRFESTVSRVKNWYYSINLIREKPVFGHGFNTLRFVRSNRGEITAQEATVTRASSGIDSSILFAAVTTGLVGLGAYVWLWYRKLQLGLTKLRDVKSRLLARVYIAVLAGTAVHSFFSNSLFYPWVLVWLWVLSAALEREVTSYT